mgnify:CR=1 FL=1
MRVLILSWEYPPHIVGGLGRHVAALARELAAEGHHVHVVTRGRPGDSAEADGWVDGVHVVRVPEAPPAIPFEDLIPWVLSFNNRVTAAAGRLLRDHPIDVIHAHDWLVTYAAAALKEIWEIPVVATIHATEYGRHQGWLPGPMNRLIHQVEWWLTYEARRVITCSRYMRDQVEDIFELPPANIDVVPNGVDLADFEVADEQARTFRASVTSPGTRMVLFAGRLEYEKGVQTVLDALRQVQQQVGPTCLFVAGVGTYSEVLRRRVSELGLEADVRFTGFLEDQELRLHYAAADVAVVPSIYEPFGLVAVEAMACGTPVIVADTGGLREIVTEGSGLTVPPEDAQALATALIDVLTDRELARTLVDGGRQLVDHRYDWSRVAHRTVSIYRRACEQERMLVGRTEERPPLRAILNQAPILQVDDAG